MESTISKTLSLSPSPSSLNPFVSSGSREVPLAVRSELRCGRHGGGGGVDGEDGKAKSAVDGAEEASAVCSDVIILDVGVSATSVNLTTETAIVWPVSEAKVIPNWQKELGINTCKTLRQIVAQV